MPSPREYEEAKKERLARERGRTLPHYAGKTARELASPPKRGKVTPAKRAES